MSANLLAEALQDLIDVVDESATPSGIWGSGLYNTNEAKLATSLRRARSALASYQPAPAPEEGEVEHAAAILICEDERIGTDIPPLEWAMKLLAVGKDAPHSGDCTKEAHTCLRCQRDDYIRKASAVLRARSQSGRAGVPEGWKLVPIEPVFEMLTAGRDVHHAHENKQHMRTDICREIYRAMLAAAPSPRGEKASAFDVNPEGQYQP